MRSRPWSNCSNGRQRIFFGYFLLAINKEVAEEYDSSHVCGARQLFVSPAHLSKIFKEATGVGRIDNKKRAVSEPEQNFLDLIQPLYMEI